MGRSARCYASVGIHDSIPDAWEAVAVVNGAGTTWGTMHDHSNGNTLWGPRDAHCTGPRL
ncbi:hypothetical protein ABZW30_23955 [Kitasatospora sp. NPDC004669]|uniref:hypothetical protein n=1 Tax=Kitasatospora sp. NPDC004669 TaxID=3154555 RepID=UPI0033B69326